ncbi:MAG: hypothetical protein ACHQ7N_17565 [Candidatus Methylomirabilales bacterium]
MEAGPISVLERGLAAVGDLLAAEGVEVGIVVVGGTALNLLGIVQRTTNDVDVLAILQDPAGSGAVTLAPPDPLPEPLQRAIARVARDFQLPEDWMNTVVGLQWQTGLPPGLERRLRWRRYGSLRVGLVARYDLIFLKLYAAADSGGPSSVHFQDLLALRPTERELQAAVAWVRGQDPTPGFSTIVEQVMTHARERAG